MPDNSQVEQMNCTIEHAMVKRYNNDTFEQIRACLQLYVGAYEYARLLKILPGFTS